MRYLDPRDLASGKTSSSSPRVTVVGWDGGSLAPAGARALADAALVAGGRRQLDALAVPAAAERLVLGDVRAAAARIAGHDGPVVVLASGDPGFFGIVRLLCDPVYGLRVDVVPAVSSVAHAFARVGLSWDDALVVSAHGRALRRAANVCRAHPKVAVLTGPDAGPAELAGALAGRIRTFVVGERLGMADERVTTWDAERLPDLAAGTAPPGGWRDPLVVLALRPEARSPAETRLHEPRRHLGPGAPGWLTGAGAARTDRPAGWALPEGAFRHRDSMITKPEVRAFVLARLGPRPGDLVWDVGAGSGSVGVECAAFGAAVVAVDRDAAACAAIAANADAHGVEVAVVHGDAPEALAGMPDPDAVFVGGGGPEVLAACAARRPDRIVATVAAVERVGPARAALAAAGYAVEGVQLSGARLSALPDGAHRLAATNPVVVLWGSVEPEGGRTDAEVAHRPVGASRPSTDGDEGSHNAACPLENCCGVGPPGREGAERGIVGSAAVPRDWGREGAERVIVGSAPAPRVPVGLVAVTAAGRVAAERLAAAWPEARHYDGPAASALPRAFAECDGVVAFLAAGAVVRILAPHLADKRTDPGVVCVDEAGRFALALLGGHGGGANALAEAAAAVLGAVPVITTASDAVGVPALDELAETMGWRIEPGSDLPGVGAALVSGAPIVLAADAIHPLPALPPNVHVESPDVSGWMWLCSAHSGAKPHPSGNTAPPPRILVTDRAEVRPGPGTVVLRPPTLIVGVGASSGVRVGEVLRAVDAALAGARLSPLSVAAVASADVKSDEGGLIDAAAARGWPIRLHPVEVLAAVPVPHPSERVRAVVGTPAVAEAAARFAGPGRRLGDLVVEKTRSVPEAARPAMATVAVARHRPRGRLAVVGLGPGARDLVTPRAVTELRRAGVLVGLDQYVDQVRDLLRPGTRVLASGLGGEEARARGAVDEALTGHAVVLVGSGDAGVYAMASPALEFADTHDVEVVVVPGVTAALAAAAVLGAPLGHDHASISLSDLHTPWEAIERRVRAAADADVVVCFYNPRSAGRTWQLPRALEILASARPPDTPVGLVREASRPEQRVRLTTLAELDATEADMRTLVVVGSSVTRVVAGRVVTPRGYLWRESSTGRTDEDAVEQSPERAPRRGEDAPGAGIPD